MIEVALGIDVGTGSTKAGFVDERGRLVAVDRVSHPPVEPRPGWSEADPATWLDAAVVAAGRARIELDRVTGGARARVVAVGLSGQMHGVVPVGDDAEPLRPAVLWSDRRSQPDLGALRKRLGPEVRGRLANPVVAGMAGPTLVALGRLEPDVMARVRVVLQPKDWVRAQLTGELATDPSDASATLLWDLEADDWCDGALDGFGVDRAWLPPVRRSMAVAGRLTRSAAERLTLEPGLAVVTGAADTAAALLGAGVAVGETQLSTGTGGQLARRLAEPVADSTVRTQLFRDAGSGWYAMAAVQNAGLAIDWAVGLLGAGPGEVAAAMARPVRGPGTSAADADPVFLPYLSGERTPHLDARLTGRWVGLRSGTDRAALIRSVHRGVALALADGLDALRAVGHPIDWALLAGGGSVAPWWRRLLADALGLPLVAHDAVDASVRGAGLLAWAGVGAEIDPAAAVTRAAPIEPDPAGAAALVGARRVFRDAHAAGWPHRA